MNLAGLLGPECTLEDAEQIEGLSLKFGELRGKGLDGLGVAQQHPHQSGGPRRGCAILVVPSAPCIVKQALAEPSLPRPPFHMP